MNKWFETSQIGRIQIELTNYCNAACPQCDRYEQYVDWKNGRINDLGLNDAWFTLKDIKKMLKNHKWDKLEMVHMCGNVDEPTVNPQMLEISKYIATNIKCRVAISTNGGTRDEEFWTNLGKLSKETKNILVVFGVDGLEDTNHIYRVHVDWKKLQRNWRAYINAGGYAEWQFIVFDHNKHQIEDAKKMSIEEGFYNFKIVQSGRADVLDLPNNDTKKKQPEKVKKQEVQTPEWYNSVNPNTIDGIPVKEFKKTSPQLECVRCPAKLNSRITKFHNGIDGNIYISAKGYVTPCCWMGNPRELDKLWKTAPNLDPKTHNVRYHSLEDIINGDWFEHINNQLQTHELCVFKCKNLIGDIHL